MRRVVAAFVEGNRVSGKSSAGVGYFVLQVIVVMECITRIVMVCSEITEVISIE